MNTEKIVARAITPMTSEEPQFGVTGAEPQAERGCATCGGGVVIIDGTLQPRICPACSATEEPDALDGWLFDHAAEDRHCRVAMLTYAMSLEVEATRLRAEPTDGSVHAADELNSRAHALRGAVDAADALALAELLDNSGDVVEAEAERFKFAPRLSGGES